MVGRCIMKWLRRLSGWLELWFVWLVVTGVTWTVSLVLSLSLAGMLAPKLSQGVSLALAGIAGGVLLGLAQWLALRPGIRGVGRWVLVTAVGWVGGLLVAALVLAATSAMWGRLVGRMLGGLVLGCIQWLALRRGARRLDWVAMTVLSWIAAMALSLLLADGARRALSEALAAVAVDVAVYGAVGLVVLAILSFFGQVLLLHDARRRDSSGYIRWWP
jgi:hypothetical protein